MSLNLSLSLDRSNSGGDYPTTSSFIPSGRGRYISEEGDRFYDGEWKDYKFHGKGILKQLSSIYEGDFVEGKKEGKGIYVAKDCAEIFQGEWKDNERINGITWWLDGSRHQGSYSSGLYHGPGYMYDSRSNSFYYGNFIHGKKRFGIWLHQSNMYCGDFVNDEFDGVGIYTWPNGDSQKALFANGDIIEESRIPLPSYKPEWTLPENFLYCVPWSTPMVTIVPDRIPYPQLPQGVREEGQMSLTQIPPIEEFIQNVFQLTSRKMGHILNLLSNEGSSSYGWRLLKAIIHNEIETLPATIHNYFRNCKSHTHPQQLLVLFHNANREEEKQKNFSNPPFPELLYPPDSLRGTISSLQFLYRLSSGRITVADIMDCEAKQLLMFLPVIGGFIRKNFSPPFSANFVDLLRPSLLDAFICKFHSYPVLAQQFYWFGVSENLFHSYKGGMVACFVNMYIQETKNFFDCLKRDWKPFVNVSENEPKTKFINPLLFIDQIPNFVIKWKIVKVFDSKAKPLLVEFLHEDNTMSRAIIKKGDDLRQDWFTMTLFEVFNLLWDTSADLNFKPTLYTYKCLPIDNEIGIIELVPNVTSVNEFDWSLLKKMNEEEKRKFISSAAGSFIASWVLGIRDRHQDNMLIKDNQTFFHIDFGHLFNNKPLVDAPRMSIPQGIQLNLDESDWTLFKDTCLNGFEILHNHGDFIKELCVFLFQGIYSSEFLSEFIHSDKSLMLDLSLNTARSKIQKHISTGSSKWNFKKKLKYSTHKFGKKESVPRLLRRTPSTLTRTLSELQRIKEL